MRKIKYVCIFIIIILLLSGCTANVEITIDKDNKVKESILITGIDYTKEELENEIQNINITGIKEYNYEVIDGNIRFERTYESVCDYANDNILGYNLFSSIECNEKKKSYVVLAEPLNQEANEKLNENNDMCEEGSDVCSSEGMQESIPSEFEYNIKVNLQNKALFNNADEIEGNSYIWHFNPYATSNKSLSLEIKKSVFINLINSSSSKVTINMILVIIIIAIVVGILSYILYNKYKKNKLDY